MEITRWSLSRRDGADFTITEHGELSFRSPPDYEQPADSNRDNVYQVTVEARDEDDNVRRLEVTVTVTNLTD